MLNFISTRKRVSSNNRAIRIFLSSPMDVGFERKLALDILNRLRLEFEYRTDIDMFVYEREIMSATYHFQDTRNIIRPRETDIVIVILWSRLGTLLPKQFRGPISRRRVTGTEWEFEDAIDGSRKQSGKPITLLFIRDEDSTILLSTNRAQIAEEAFLQALMVRSFKERWIFDKKNGGVKRAFYNYTDLGEFEEKLESSLRQALLKKLSASYRSHHDGQPPYLGLQAFSVDHSQFFFGRTRARAELRDQLQRQVERNHTFLLIIGASGSGKSSLVMAGLIADLTTPGVIAGHEMVGYRIFRPSAFGNQLEFGLASTIAEIFQGAPGAATVQSESILEALRSSNNSLETMLERALQNSNGSRAKNGKATFAIVIDQLEELFTDQSIDEDTRNSFIALLGRLSRSGYAWIIATMRSDFYPSLEQINGFSTLASRDGSYVVRAPDDTELEQIISGPARRVGLSFEKCEITGSPLNEVIRAAVARNRAALPLLGHLMFQLWQRRTVDGELTFAAYSMLGQLEGAISTTAEMTYLSLPQEQREAFPSVLRELVTISNDDHSRVTSRILDLSQFSTESIERKIVDSFSAQATRLFEIDRAANSGTTGQIQASTARIAHEALLTHWPRATGIIDEDRADLAARSRLETLALHWERAKFEEQSDYLIPDGSQLNIALDLKRRRSTILKKSTITFIDASERASSNRRRSQEEQRSRDLGNLARFRVRNGEIETALADAIRALPSEEDDSGNIQDEVFDALELCLQLNQALTVFRSHKHKVNQAIFHPCENIIASGDEGGEILIWNADTLEILHRMLLEAPVTNVIWASGGKILVGFSENGKMQIWDRNNWECINQISITENKIRSADVDRNCKFISLSNNDTVSIFNLENLQTPFLSIKCEDHVNRVRFNNEGSSLACALENGAITLFNFDSRTTAELGRHSAPAYGLSFSGNGQYLASGSKDKTVKVWDLHENNLKWSQVGHDLDVYDVCFTPDGEFVTSGSHDRTARLWKTLDGSSVGLLRGHTNWIYGVSIQASSQVVATASSDRTVRVWRSKPGIEHIAMTGHTGNVKCVSVSNLSRLLASGSDDGTIRIWDLENNYGATSTFLGHESYVRSVTFCRDDRGILSGSWDGTARLWDVNSGDTRTIFAGHSGPVRCASIDSDGTLVATASLDRTVRIWCAHSGHQLRKIDEVSEVYSVKFSPDGQNICYLLKNGELVSCLFDGTILWRVLAHEAIGNQLSYSFNGKYIATVADDSKCVIWCSKSGKKMREYLGHEHWVTGVAFHPSDNWIVTCSFDKTARIWNVVTGERVCTLRGHENTVYSTCFDNSGEQVVTASHDQTIGVWHPTLERNTTISQAKRLHNLIAPQTH